MKYHDVNLFDSTMTHYFVAQHMVQYDIHLSSMLNKLKGKQSDANIVSVCIFNNRYKTLSIEKGREALREKIEFWQKKDYLC